MERYREILVYKTEETIDKIKNLIASIDECLLDFQAFQRVEFDFCESFNKTNSDKYKPDICFQIDCLQKVKQVLLEEIELCHKSLQDCLENIKPNPKKYPSRSINIIPDDAYLQVHKHDSLANEINQISERTLCELNGMLNDSRFPKTEKIFFAMHEYNQIAVELSKIHTNIAQNMHRAIEVYSKCEDALISKFVEREEQKGCYTPMTQSQNPPPNIDTVQFSVIASEKTVAGKYFPISIVMYEEQYRKYIDSIVLSHGKDAKESKGGFCEIEHNAKVKVILSSPDLIIEDNAEERIWSGKYINFEFVVKIPNDFIDKQILFVASVYINNVIATRLKLVLDCEGVPSSNIKVTRNDISSAFVSYASQDRSRVAAIVQGMEKARPDMDIFFDVESLRSGQKWEEVLKNEIDGRDVLFLCWSKFAKDSEWVDMEWRYALERKGEEGIEPIPIDSPDVCPPPSELKQKHFNDRILYIIK